MSSRFRKAPRIADVARAAGVSPTTVSFVLNDWPQANISNDTRERVWSAARELGYRPNAAAKVLRTQRTHTIGFVTDEIAVTPFAGNVIKGAQDCAWQNKKLLMIVNTGNDRQLMEAAVEALLERQVEGIIYAAMYHQAIDPPSTLSEVPTVLLDCFSPDGSLASVVPDEQQGGRVATEALLEAGHRRIGYINLTPTIPAAIGRLAGYRAALERAGVQYDPALVREGDGDAARGYSEALALMQLPAPPSAIFCATDRTAMGAYDALRELGLRIPRDVSIVGFDNQKLIADYLRPGLTTVQLPHYEMGRWAVEYLIEQSDADAADQAPPQMLLQCPLVSRASVAPPSS